MNQVLINQAELIEQLVKLGLSKIDATVFLLISKSGEITAREISRSLDIQRGVVYQSLNNLKNFGMINTTFSNPARCIAVNSDKALQSVVSMKKNEFIMSQKLSKNIVFKLNEIANPIKSAKDSFFSVIQGRYNAYSKISHILENATSEVFIISTIDDIVKLYHTSIPEKIKRCTKRGVQVNILTQFPSEKTIPLLNRFGTTNFRFKKNLHKSRIIIEKDAYLLISDNLNSEIKNTNESALFTNSPDMINNILILCKQLWNRSVPIERIQKSQLLT